MKEEEVEYIYAKPPENKRHYKMLIALLILFVVTAIALDFLFINNNENDDLEYQNFTEENETYEGENQIYTVGNETFTIPTVPTEYKGTEGLVYIKENSQEEINKASSACIYQFKGEWIDDTHAIGCYNMQGFLTLYCIADIIQALSSLCNDIEGNYTCSDTQVVCVV